MQRLAVYILCVAVVSCEANVRRPQDIFPQDGIYNRPTDNSHQVPNPFKDTFNRDDPDALYWGFFPLWAAALAAISILFAFIALLGLMCHLLGCRNPYKPKPKKNVKAPKRDIYYDDRFDEASLKMMDQNERIYESSFQNSKLDIQ